MSDARCEAMWPGSYPEQGRCERWAGHDGPHAMGVGLVTASTWTDAVACKHCGEPITVPSTDHLRRWKHFATDDRSCRLHAEPSEP